MATSRKQAKQPDVSAKDKNRYRVFQLADESDEATEIGVVTLSDDHKLRLVSAVAARREFLEKLVAHINAASVVHVNAPPPPEAERTDLYSRPVSRSAAGFRQALIESLNESYGIELKPA